MSRMCALVVVLSMTGMLFAQAPASAPATQPAIVFKNSSAGSGIAWPALPRDVKEAKAGTVYCGWQFDVFLFDADGDGIMDMASPSHHPSDLAPGGLWLGKGDGTFGANLMERKAVSAEKGSPWIFSGYGTALDIDADGDLDFYVSERGGLYLNQGTKGEGAERVVSFARTDLGAFRAAVFGDFNKDGNVDFFGGVQLLMGGGKGTLPAQWKEHAFSAVMKEQNALYQYGVVHQAVSADFDRDGSVDLLANPSLANPRIDKEKQIAPRTLLYMNDGKGGFVERSKDMGLTDGPPQGPVIAADFDNDGFFDAVVAGRGKGMDDQKRRIRLYANRAGKSFIPSEAKDTGLEIADTADYNIVYCCGLAADLDNDGLLDVVYGDGMKGYRVFRNLGGLKFEQMALLRPAARMARPAAADLNGDGLLDLVVNEGTTGMTIYLNESAAENGWIEISVKGLEGNASGIGSLVEVFKAGKMGDRSAYVGIQHVTAENDTHLPLARHFGLGKEPAADVRITLPTGQTLELAGIKPRSRATADFPAGKVLAK